MQSGFAEMIRSVTRSAIEKYLLVGQNKEREEGEQTCERNGAAPDDEKIRPRRLFRSTVTRS